MSAAAWRKTDASAFANVLNSYALVIPGLTDVDFKGWHIRGQRFRVPGVGAVQVGFGRVSIGRAVLIPGFNRVGMAPVRNAVLVLEVFLSAFAEDSIWQPIFNASLDALDTNQPTGYTVIGQLFEGPTPDAIPNPIYTNFHSVTGVVPYWVNT